MDGLRHDDEPLDGDAPFSDDDEDGADALSDLREAFAGLLGRELPAGEGAAEGAAAEPLEAVCAEEEAELPDAAPLPPPGEPAEAAAEIDASPRTILEAMLFVGSPNNRPLAPRYAAALLRGVSPREVDQLVRELNALYEAEGCPYVIVSETDGYRMTLREQFAGLRDVLLGRIREARLSQPAIDVLAIVAYHQPVTREKVAELRGRPSGPLLTQLVRRQLLRIERSDGPARDVYYHTTDRFLRLFGLESLADLPQTREMDLNL